MQAGIVLAHFSYSPPPQHTYSENTHPHSLSLSLSRRSFSLLSLFFSSEIRWSMCPSLCVCHECYHVHIYSHHHPPRCSLSLSLCLSVSVLAFVLDFSREKRQAAADRFVTHTRHTQREKRHHGPRGTMNSLQRRSFLSFLICVLLQS